MKLSKAKTALAGLAALLAITVFARSYAERDSIPVTVNIPSLSISKLPFVVALDQGLYAKHGLRANVWVPAPRGLTLSYYWSRVLIRLGMAEYDRPDFAIDGGSPMIVRVSQRGPSGHQIMIGATDCVVRAHVIGRKGIKNVAELKGGRIGVSNLGSTAGFHALLLAKRMDWDPVQDVTLFPGYEGMDGLLDGSLDALIGYEFEFADAKREGLPILLDTRDWNEAIAGNSIMVAPGWLDDPTHREAARRFLRATAEAVALVHQQPQLVKRVLAEWYGVTDPERAQIVYERGAWIPRKPYPCYEGIESTMALYDSNEMRRYKPSDFYDDSMMREVDDSGFIDALYKDSDPALPTAQSALQSK